MDKWSNALLLYRNTPRRPSNESPATLLFGRPLRDGLPTTSNSFKPQWQEAKQRRAQAVEEYRQKLSQLDTSTKFKVGDRVALQDPTTKRWTKEGRITEVGRKFREVAVEVEGVAYRRNQKFVKLLPELPSHITPKPQAMKKNPERHVVIREDLKRVRIIPARYRS